MTECDSRARLALWVVFSAVAITTAWKESEIIWLFLSCGVLIMLLKAPLKLTASPSVPAMLPGLTRLVSGVHGAVALGTIAVFAPLYFLVLIGAPYYRRFVTVPQVKAFLQGVSAAAVGAIAGAAYILARRSLIDLPTMLIAIVTLPYCHGLRKSLSSPCSSWLQELWACFCGEI